MLGQYRYDESGSNQGREPHLTNDKSKEKAKIGNHWAKLARKQYKYYLIFKTKQLNYPRIYSLERFIRIVTRL